MITSLSVNTGGLGRFGNQMFTIASTIGIAVKNNQPFGFPEWINRDNEFFGGTADKMADYFVNPLPPIPDGLHFENVPYHWNYMDYKVESGNWNICSHLQDERYFAHCMPIIRHYFRMKGEGHPANRVSIHYRAGDYLDDQSAYHPRCSKEYYQEAINQFPVGTNFTIFTDDVDAFDSLGVDFTGMSTHFTPGRSYIEDFKFMKTHKSFITANSSFSLMAAILGEHPGKKIICPKRWFGSSAGITFEGYPKGAIVI